MLEATEVDKVGAHKWSSCSSTMQGRIQGATTAEAVGVQWIALIWSTMRSSSLCEITGRRPSMTHTIFCKQQYTHIHECFVYGMLSSPLQLSSRPSLSLLSPYVDLQRIYRYPIYNYIWEYSVSRAGGNNIPSHNPDHSPGHFPCFSCIWGAQCFWNFCLQYWQSNSSVTRKLIEDFQVGISRQWVTSFLSRLVVTCANFPLFQNDPLRWS